MGRPAKFCKENAVAIAMEAFWDKGYEAVSVSQLAAAMSITRSSFYNCFKTRDALFEKVIDLYKLQAPDYCLTQLGPNDPIIPAMRTSIKNLCRDRAADPDARGCLIITSLAQIAAGDITAPPLVAMMKAKIDRYDFLLTTATERGEAQISDPSLAARTLLTHMMGINMICKIIRSEEELWAISDQVLTSIGIVET